VLNKYEAQQRTALDMIFKTLQQNSHHEPAETGPRDGTS
jgi:hypothetical protein